MKVVCDACHAKYQVPDERVAGRKLKIRCRRCSAAIIVQGDALAGDVPLASEPPPALYGADSSASAVEWHVSLDGEQHGPYPTEQMAGMLRGSQLDWDAYVWRESYGDWKSASDSDTLVRAVAAAAEDAPTAAVATPLDDSPFDTENDPTRMVQSSSPEALMPVARTTFAARAKARVGSQPPETNANALPRASSQPPMTSSYVPRAQSQPPMTSSYVPRAQSQPPVTAQSYAQAPVPVAAYSDVYAGDPPAYGGYAAAPAYSDRRGAPVDTLTGERHEDSVLFAAQSLSLSANAAPAPAPRGGYAAAEGSGLIDIRALAALARSNQSAPPPASHGNASHHGNANGNNTGALYPSNGSSNGTGNYARSSDALLTLANQTGAFSSLDSLAPLDRPSSASNKAVPAAILGGFLMVAAAILIAVYIARPPAQQPVAAASTVTAPIVAAPELAPAAAPEPAAPAPAAQVAPVAAAEPEPEAAPSEPAARERASSGRSRSRSARTAKPEVVSAKAVKAEVVKAEKVAKAEKPESKKDKAPSIDELIAAEKNPVAAKAEEPKPASIDDDLLATPAPSKAAPTRSRSIDELLDTAVVEGRKPAAAPSEAALPDSPTREQVKSAMAGVSSAVLACGEGQELESTQAQVAVTVAGATGRVTSARVTGVQGAVGSCVARAVREATFPKFAKPSLSINFPFKLK